MSEGIERVCLPPGLWLPTADEDPNQFLAENYDRNTEAWRIVEYGTFAVALIAFEVADGKRVSAMPSKQDFKDLHRAGYGPSEQTVGSIHDLQVELGFYPKGYQPEKEIFIERYQQIAETVLDPVTEFGENFRMRQIFEWCSRRHIAGGVKIAGEMFNGDTTPIRRLFDLETRRASQYQKRTVYEVGADILANNDKLPSGETFGNSYKEQLGMHPRTLLNHHFKGSVRFWLEFDKIRATEGLVGQDIISLATRLAIRTGDRILADANTYRANQELPGVNSTIRLVGGLKVLRKEVAQELEVYDDLVIELEQIGVSPEITQAFCGRFAATPEFRDWLISGKSFLTELPEDRAFPFVLKLVREGLNLLEPALYDLQLEELGLVLNRLSGENSDEWRFALEAIPRLDPDEAIDRIAQLRKRTAADWVIAR